MSCCGDRKLISAVQAADELLLALGRPLPLEKADDPNDRKQFDRIVARILRELMAVTENLDTTFAVRVLNALDVDLEEMTAAERENFLQKAELALPRPARYAKVVAPVFAAEAESLVALARLKALDDVAVPLIDFADDAVVQHLADGQAYYVAAAMQQRNLILNQQIRTLVGKALEQGWTRAYLTKQLEKILEPEIILARQGNYLDVVAASFVGYARTYGRLTAYRDADIREYVWESVLDEVTCDVCRFLHGTVFEVQAGLSVFERMTGNLDSSKEAAPWIRVGPNEFGERTLYTKAFGHRRELAVVTRSGVGNRDDLGEYSTTYDARKLEGIGACVPPIHGRCRCTTVANV